ncbi:MAG: hypothetical protein IMW86_03060 [Hydrogenibacillus sp.]|nr:hypothetical protein [Hydrogenibacillus sp.]
MQTLAFRYDPEVDLELPTEERLFAERPEAQDGAVWARLERLAGLIPERIRAMEAEYEAAYARVLESEGEAFFEAMDRVNALSRKIAELNVWYWRIAGRHIPPYYG